MFPVSTNQAKTCPIGDNVDETAIQDGSALRQGNGASLGDGKAAEGTGGNRPLGALDVAGEDMKI